MKPPPFAYHAPGTVEEVVEVLAETGDDGKVLAGGQSLIPLMNMRLAAPDHLVDIGGVAGLDSVEVTRDGVRVGALVRQAALEHNKDVFRTQPLLREALGFVAHPVVRNRGTVVGSLAHADPAGELPALLALLEGTVEVVRRGGQRSVPASGFFLGSLESCLEPDELAVSAYFPALPSRTGAAFAEVARRHGDFAVCGAVGTVTLEADGRVAAARAAYLSVAPTPLVLDLTEACGGRPVEEAGWSEAAEAARSRISPDGDIHASTEYRRHLAGVLTERVLREAGWRAGGTASRRDEALPGAPG